MALQSLLDGLRAEMVDCLGTAYVEIEGEVTSPIATSLADPAYTSLLRDAVRAVGSFLFAETDSLAEWVGTEQSPSVAELVLFSKDLIHIYARGQRYPNRALLFVCRGAAGGGANLGRARLALAKLESL